MRAEVLSQGYSCGSMAGSRIQPLSTAGFSNKSAKLEFNYSLLIGMIAATFSLCLREKS